MLGLLLNMVEPVVEFRKAECPVDLRSGEFETVFRGQLSAYLGVADLDVLVRNSLPVISDPVVDQMAVRMGLVEMANQ